MLKEKLKKIFNTIYLPETNINQLIEDNFSKKYIQRVDSVTLNYDQFVQHVHLQRKVVENVKITFLHLVEEGNTLASMHLVEAKKKDGSQLKAKIVAVFQFENNKLILCDELTYMIEGSESDRDLGRRH